MYQRVVRHARMRTSAIKSEEKRLRWFAPTGVDQTKSWAKPLDEARNRVQFARQPPEPPHDVTTRLEPGAKRYQYRTEGVLLGECRFKTDHFGGADHNGVMKKHELFNIPVCNAHFACGIAG